MLVVEAYLEWRQTMVLVFPAWVALIILADVRRQGLDVGGSLQIAAQEC